MAYAADKKPGELTALTTLATDDILVVGDTSDASEVAKGITKANLITDLGTSFAPALGADDNYVTDAEKTVIGNTSGTNTGDNAVNSNYSGLVSNATHTGEVTGSGALTVDKTAITGKTLVTAAVGDHVLVADASDADNLKKVTVQTIVDLAASGISDGDKGDITVSVSGTVWTLDDSVVTNAKMAGMADGTIKGRALSAGAGPATDLSATQVRTLINVEDGADVTDTTNVTSAGALMDSECTSLASVKALDQGVATTDSPQFAGVNVGHASDTTITRTGAGAIAVEGVAVPTISSTNTLTNKRITKRTGTTTSHATPTINTDNVDEYYITAQTEAITSFTTNLSGTPTEGQLLFIAVTGTAARAITWGASFENGPVALPTTTVTTTRLDTLFKWNTVTSKWRCMATGSTV